jgi:VanZ family protein
MAWRPFSSWIASDLGRWLVWGVALFLWTVALLRPEPIQVSQVVLPSAARFPAAKTLHVTAYAVLTILTALLPLRRTARLWPLLLLVLHGPATEYLQNFVTLRSGSVMDAAFDMMGIGLGLILTAPWWLRDHVERHVG